MFFTNIYENKILGNNNNDVYNGSSGNGSSINYNKDSYVPFLKKFIIDNNIKNIVDLGCGDFICGKLIYNDFDILYTGYDTYKKIIDYNSTQYLLPKYSFKHLDFYNNKENIINGDICILKDVIQHWSLDNIHIFLDFLIENKKFKYILICNCCNQLQDNTNIINGDFRPLSCNYFPLKKYNPLKLYNYDTKEVCLIDLTSSINDIVIAILAKDKECVLDKYLECIYNQTYNKKNIHLYIVTNDNNDNTETILTNFISKYKDEYASIYFSSKSIDEKVKKYKNHEWNELRFSVLAKIRQDSIDYAIKKNAHYFVADCDNFIINTTLQDMFNVKQYGVISPMLQCLSENKTYSNYHYNVDNNGYYKSHENYFKILNYELIGLNKVDVVHCTYFINNSILNNILYSDNTKRHEYVIFSDILRKKNINQYIDNRKKYGYLTFSETKEDLDKEFKIIK